MRNIFILALCMTIMATLSYGQTNVLSQNAVGYVKVTVPRDGLALVRLDFLPIDPADDPIIANIIGDQLPILSKAHIWDSDAGAGGLGGYISVTKTLSGWPTTGNGATPINQGDAFWLEVPASAAEPEYDVYLMGEVPGKNNNQETNTVFGSGGVDAIGYPYPSAIAWGDTTLAPVLPPTSKLHIWDPYKDGIGGYDSRTKTISGWGTANDIIIEPGTAFWVETASSFEWDEEKPYTWP